VEVLATDLPADHATAAAWSFGGQHAASHSSLHYPAIVGRRKFDKNVKFRPTDMTDLSGFEKAYFDFIWSSCSMEHLGSLEAGVQFVLESLSLLKEGGVAVHTTEFNCSSNERTVEVGPCVIYRRGDLEELGCRVRRTGCWMEPWDFYPGCSAST
jgi:methyltransferase family protein